MNKAKIKFLINKSINFFTLAVVAAGAVFLVSQPIKTINKNLADLEGKLNIYGQKIAQLENRIEEVALQKSIVKEEVIRREVIREKSQEELLTSAVAKISPAVVSIVVTKDVPKLEIVYENPFGNDPFFKDFDIKIPVWRQKGVEKQKVGAGTGFLIKSDGYVLTNRHVVEDTEATYTVLLVDGSQKEAQIAYRDDNNDIAILKIAAGKYTFVELGNSSQLRLGQSVFAVGNALGEYSNSVSVGIVSGLNRTIEATDQSGGIVRLNDVIQTDAAINPGNSGGPLVDLQGKVIGINVATIIGSNSISFSIPINTAKTIIQTVLK